MSAGDDERAALRRALHGDDPGLRWEAALRLAQREPPGPALLPALVEALGAPEGDVRWQAARLLVDAGRLHGEVLALLIGLAQDDPRPRVRSMAAHALRALAPDRPECAAALVAASRDPHAGVRRAALTALAGLMDPPASVAGCLREALEREESPALRTLAERALSRLGQGPEGPAQRGAAERSSPRQGPEGPAQRGAAERSSPRQGPEGPAQRGAAERGSRKVGRSPE